MKRRGIRLPSGRRIKLSIKPLSPKPRVVAAKRPRSQQPAAPRPTIVSPVFQSPLPSILPESRTSSAAIPESNDVQRWQIDPQEKEQLLTSVSEVQQLVQDCRQVQDALARTGQPSIRSLPLNKWAPTEFERAQRRLIDACKTALRQLYRVRRKNISPTAIHSTHILILIRECCRQCRKVNLANLTNGRPFECLAQAQLTQADQPGFRYRLNEKGEIYE